MLPSDRVNQVNGSAVTDLEEQKRLREMQAAAKDARQAYLFGFVSQAREAADIAARQALAPPAWGAYAQLRLFVEAEETNKLLRSLAVSADRLVQLQLAAFTRPAWPVRSVLWLRDRLRRQADAPAQAPPAPPEAHVEAG